MTGVPSARDHRLLKLDSGELKCKMQRQNVVNCNILQTFHYQQNELYNLTQQFGTLAINSQQNTDAVEKIFFMLSISTKINAALESARITIAHMKSIVASDKHSHLSKFFISTSQLSEIIDNVYLKHKKISRFLPGWNATITPMHQKSELVVLDEPKKIHADLPFVIPMKETNTFRFLSMSDYAKCMSADNAVICQKRSVHILKAGLQP